jgi:thymidylate synthase
VELKSMLKLSGSGICLVIASIHKHWEIYTVRFLRYGNEWLIQNGHVNSNYGYQWKRNDQIDMVVQMLKQNPETRQACISIYDGKEITDYAFDTPCTYAIQFTIVHGRLDMCVTMRSNDLWYGFCNDQYQFSRLQEMVSKRLEIETGVYYHFAHNMHLYNDKI